MKTLDGKAVGNLFVDLTYRNSRWIASPTTIPFSFEITGVARERSSMGRSPRSVNFYSAAALLAMQSAVIPTAIPSVCPSVRLSVTRWYPIQTNERRITRSSL